jgi:hypothetical protein
VLRAPHDVRPHEVALVEVAQTKRIRQTEGLASFPDLERRRHMEDLRAGVRLHAALQDSVGGSGEGVLRRPVAERELVGGIQMVGLMPPGPTRLSEADVERRASAADVRIGALEHDAPLFVLVEAEMDEGAHVAAALGAALEDRREAGSLAFARAVVGLRWEPQRVRVAEIVRGLMLEE